MSEARFRAGCGRQTDGPADVFDLAYTEWAFDECPSCPHRIDPDEGASFCLWQRPDRPDRFAELRDLLDVEPPT